MRLAPLIIVLLLMSSLTYSQDNILYGHVVDINLNPLGNARVTTKENILLTLTDKSGFFQIEKSDEVTEVLIQFIGMRTEKIAIDNICYINVIMLDEVLIEFKSKRQEDKYFNRQRKRVKNKYRQAIKSGILQEEQECK
jgi:hypothetical protein